MRVVAIAAILCIVAAPVLARDFEDVTAGYKFIEQPATPIWGGPTAAILFDNGPLLTHVGTGVGGADESWVQTLTFFMSLYGFGFQHDPTIDNRMGDDFTVPAGECWRLEGITFFGYQTNAPTSGTITGMYYEIWDGAPWAGGTRIYGDLTTNRQVSSGWTNIYRVLDTTTGTSSSRAIQAVQCDASVDLGAGQYWVVWQADGNPSYSGPWMPPVTILGTPSTGDGYQYTSSSGAWAPALDSGAGAQQGLPFILEGTFCSTATETATWGTVKAQMQ